MTGRALFLKEARRRSFKGGQWENNGSENRVLQGQGRDKPKSGGGEALLWVK